MKKIGLALSTGGARGLSHIGVINVLKKNNIPIDYIAGTSMGAIVAAYYALNLEVKSLGKKIVSMSKRDFIKLIDLNNPKKSIIKGIKIRNFLKTVFKDYTFKDTKIPLQVTSTSLNDGKLVVFKSGKIIDAVIASATYPGVFPPVKFKGRYLVDGGLIEPTPISLLQNMGAEKSIGVDLGVRKLTKHDNTNIIFVIQRTLEIMLTGLSRHEEKTYGKDVLILRPNIGSKINTFSFHKSKNYISKGQKETEENIKKIKRFVK